MRILQAYQLSFEESVREEHDPELVNLLDATAACKQQVRAITEIMKGHKAKIASRLQQLGLEPGIIHVGRYTIETGHFHGIKGLD